MYYILKEEYALRSWKYVPYAYLTKNCSTARGVGKEEFEILKKCNGKTDIEESDIVNNLIEKELIVPCEKGVKSLSEWQSHIVCNNRYLPMLNLQITGKCNYNCRHCFNCADNAPLQSEISYEQMTNLLDDCVKCGVTSFTVTGGEPFIHPRFRDILAEIYKRNMFIFELNTNGFFVNEEILDYMISIDCKPEIKISFDGIGYHDWMRGHKGAEEKALKAIKLCLQKGFKVRVQMNVNKKNADSIYSSLLMLDEMGVPETRLIKTTNAPRWEQNAKGMDYGWAEFYDFIADLFSKYAHEAHKMAVDVWQTLYYNSENHYYNINAVAGNGKDFDGEKLICTTARSMLAVSSTGEVYGCMQMQGFMEENHISFGNVFRDGLKNVLGESKLMQLICLSAHDRLEKNTECGNCKYLKYCYGGCPCLSILTNGNDYNKMLAPDRTKCIMLKEGYYEKMVAVFGEENNNSCKIEQK